jgi:molybdopterin converting factor subunit 1
MGKYGGSVGYRAMSSSSEKQIRIQYFALLREERGTREEVVNTEAATPQQLYEELRRRHNFSLDAGRLRVAINDEFVGWDSVLAPQDCVVFIPPVAGG